MNKKLLIYLGVIFVVIAGFVIFINTSLENSIKRDTKKPPFGNVFGDKYVFYYPNTYVEGKGENDEALLYENPDTRAVESEKIFLMVGDATGGLGVPDYKICERASESYRQSSEDKITVSVASGQDVGVGCMVTVETPITGTSDSAMLVEKILWYPSGDDLTVHRVRAVFFGVASADQADMLRASVQQFSLR